MAEHEQTDEHLFVGPWRVDPVGLRLIQGDDEARLQPQTMRLLEALADARGEALTKDALSNAVWGDEGASDDLLARHVSMIRQALGDDARKPRWLETIPRVGYRLRCEWRAAEAARPSPAASAGVADPMGRSRRPILWLALAPAIGVLVALLLPLGSDGPQPGAVTTTTSLPLVDEGGLGGDVSAGGGRVVYVGVSDETLSGPLFLVDADGNAAREIAPGPARYPALSPAGDRLAYVASGARCRLVILDSLFEEAHSWRCPGAPMSPPSWTPDGDLLVAWGDGQDAGILERFDPDSGTRTTLRLPGTPAFPHALPNGDVLLALARTGTTRVVRVRPDGGTEPFLELTPRRLRWLDFEPDSERLLLLASDRVGRYAAFEALLGETDLRRLGIGADIQSASFRGTEQIVYAQVTYRRVHQLHRIEADASITTRPLTLPDPSAARVVVSPDGASLTYLAESSQGTALKLASVDGAFQHRVLGRSGVNELLDHPTWEGDGEHVLVAAGTPDGTRLRRFLVASGERVADVPVPAPIYGIHPTAEGAMLETRRDATVELRPWTIGDAAPGAAIELEGITARPAGESGTYLLARTDGTLAEWRAPEVLRPLIHLGAPSGWLVRGGAVYFACPGGDRPAILCSARLEDGRGIALRDIRYAPPMLSASADGTVVVVGLDEEVRIELRQVGLEPVTGRD